MSIPIQGVQVGGQQHRHIEDVASCELRPDDDTLGCQNGVIMMYIM